MENKSSVCYQVVLSNSDHLDHLRTQRYYFLPDCSKLNQKAAQGLATPSVTLQPHHQDHQIQQNNFATHKSQDKSRIKKKKWQLHGQETQDTHAPNHPIPSETRVCVLLGCFIEFRSPRPSPEEGTEKSMSAHFFCSLCTTMTSGWFSATPRLISLFQKSSILPFSSEHTVLGT